MSCLVCWCRYAIDNYKIEAQFRRFAIFVSAILAGVLPGVIVPVRHGQLDHHGAKTCTRFSRKIGKNPQRIKNVFCLFQCSNLKQKKNLQFAFIANKCWVFLQTFWQTSIFRFVRGAVIKILSFQALQDTNKFVLAEMKRE